MQAAAEGPQVEWQEPLMEPLMEPLPDVLEEPPFQEVRAARRGRGAGRGAGRGRGVAPARGEGRGEGRGAGRGAGRGRGRGAVAAGGRGEARGGRVAGRGAGRGRGGRGGRGADVPQPEPVAKKNCSVCWSELPVRRGVQCCEEGEASCHFVCSGCMDGMVKSYCAMDDDSVVIGKLREDSLDALIACPGYGPDGNLCQHRFKNSRIIKTLSPEAIERMQRAILMLTEKRVMRSFEQQMRERLRLEVTKYLNMDERTRAVEEHKTHVIEQILNLRCPRCQVAFVEFDGCLAVNCSSCNAGFCVCCLADCGNDAHPHVLECEYNPRRGDYGSSGDADLNTIHKPRREQAVRDYLDANVFEASMREEIIKELTPFFADLNVDVAALSPVSKAG